MKLGVPRVTKVKNKIINSDLKKQRNRTRKAKEKVAKEKAEREKIVKVIKEASSGENPYLKSVSQALAKKGSAVTKNEKDKVIRRSKVISGIWKEMQGFTGEIRTKEDIFNCLKIAKASEEILNASKVAKLNEDEIAYYKDILMRYAGYVKAYFLMPNEKKPKSIIDYYKQRLPFESEDKYKIRLKEYDNAIRDCFDILARQFDLDSFLIALEWNRKPENQFYLPRRDCLINLEDINGEKFSIVQDLQDLIDGKLIILTESMPQRTGKSRLSLFTLTLMAFKNLEKSIFGVGHSSGLIDDFYNEIISIYSDIKTYRAFEIFKNHALVHKDSDKHTIDLDRRKGLSNFMFRSIDGNITGSTEASLCMYCDDLIKDQSEVINKDIADKIWSKVQVLVLGRMKEGVPLLYVGTPWGENCPLSRLIDEYSEYDNPKYRFRKIAWHNSKGESQFNYKYNLGFSTEHFKKLEKTMAETDYALWCALYESNPISREGRPFAKIKYYTSLPERKPDFVCTACDVAVSAGGDYWSLPIGYVYEKEREVYIEDIVYSNLGTDYTIPKTVEKIIQHKVEKGEFEEKEGALNKKANYGVTDTVNRMLKEKGYRCNLGCHSASGQKSKKSRILSCRSEILAIDTDYSYKVYFKDASLRYNDTEYNNFIKHILAWSDADSMQKRQKDDGVDSISMLIVYNLDNRNGKAKLFNVKLY